MNKLISVIVPIYNAEKYLNECIQSIVKQTYPYLQIILVDDGSTDQSGSICDSYAVQDERIEVVHQENAGIVAARKCGLSRANGDYIGFVDADDYIQEEMYESLLQNIGDAELIHSIYFENDRKKRMPVSGVVDFHEGKAAFLESAVLGESAYLSPSMWSKLYQTDFIKRCFMKVPNECSFGEDLLCLCISVMESHKIVLLNEAYYHYRVLEGSMSHQKGITNIRNILTLYDGIEKVMSSYEEHEIIKQYNVDWFWTTLLGYIKKEVRTFGIQNYYLEEVELIQDKKIVIYGAGVVGQDYYAQISRYPNCKIVAWIDTKPENYNFEYIEVCGKAILPKIDFDILIIAVKRKNMADEIKSQLLMEGVEASKIYWKMPKRFVIS